MNGGTISGCKATGNMANGGGVYLNNIKTFSMGGGTISNNTAAYLGGGIYIGSEENPQDKGYYEITAGKISGNNVIDLYGFGGGIYVPKGRTLHLRNALITGNMASALGGGIWACRTGDIKVYITDGGAVYDNDAIAKDLHEKTPGQAGDDIAFVDSIPFASTMTLYKRMLGGGLNHYYKDGGITWLQPGADHTAGPGLGAPDGNTPRYSDSNRELLENTENITGFTALKNVVSDKAKETAQRDVKLTITDNSASRGGGIGTNGNLIIGKPDPDPDAETGNLTVKKEVTGSNQETNKEFYIQITLTSDDPDAEKISGEYGEMKFKNGVATVTLKAGQSVTATGLPMDITYEVEETAESRDGYKVTYTNQTGTIKNTTVVATVTNTKDTPEPPPKTGGLTVSKTVSGSGADISKEFTFTVKFIGDGLEDSYPYTLTSADGNFVTGNLNLTENKGTFKLKHSQTITITGLPAGTQFEITESEMCIRDSYNKVWNSLTITHQTLASMP